jgi:uncharacterized membrane protein
LEKIWRKYTTMASDKSQVPYLVRPLPVYFLGGLILVNFIAIFQWDPLYIGSLFAFLYIIITPGFLFLPFLTQKKLAPVLGVAFSIAVSILMLMLVGLAINTILPLWGIHQPLTTIPLLAGFDGLIYLLLISNFIFKKNSPFEFHEFNFLSSILATVSVLLPVLACLGAIVLNNGGSNFLTMLAYGIAAMLVLVIVFTPKDKMSPSIPPLSLCMMALSFLLMNSMRGWFITGHDILLEYHVFTLVNTAHYWSMSLFQDPYMACLSLTILPTYLQQLLHVSPAYIFKFFTQFIGALAVIVVYYIAKEYVSEKIAFLAAFLYITFPTFLVDMAFLNRQGIAFLFFSSMLFAMFTTEHFSGWKRYAALFIFGIGIILSHYSTSYVTIALLAIAYIVNWLLRFLATAKKPVWFSILTNRLGNKEIYERPILLTLPFVAGMFALMFLWSTVITKTSTSLFDTIQQIATSIEHPFTFDESTGPAKYSLVTTGQTTPQALLTQFVQQGITSVDTSQHPSAFYPTSITENYSTTPVAETLTPITPSGGEVQSILHINLVDFYNDLKLIYAKVLQVLLLVGLIGLAFGYGFRKNILRNVPREYIALSIAGIIILAVQTVLPASAIDYGLLRLFQQNLILFALPITLGFLGISMLIIRNHKGQLAFCTVLLLFFFLVLSGVLPQLTGGGRAALALNNYGLYYDAYYMHAQEISAMDWTNEYANPSLPIQAAHFSDIKMAAFGKIAPHIELLPQTIRKDAYVFLNYENVTTSNIIEVVNGDILYYHFPLDFLANNKNLIYNNGGSEIYQ